MGSAEHCLATLSQPGGWKSVISISLFKLFSNRHLLLNCPALHFVMDKHPALFSSGKGTMQLSMWQPDVVQHVEITNTARIPYMIHRLFFGLLGAASTAHDDSHRMCT